MRIVDPALFHRAPPPADAALTLRYLATAGFVVEGLGHTVVIDPYITRPGVIDSLFKPLIPDAAKIRRYLPKADDVVVGHAHHDHVLDAPELCRQTGARLIGSSAVCNVGRAAGLPESQLVETAGREDIASGPFTLRGLPSLHGRVYGRVTLPGDITAPPQWPPRMFDLRHGLVLNWYLEAAGVRMVHVDSADFIEEELRGMKADVVCLCAIGRQYRPRYVESIVELLQPRYVIPCHWDLFTVPLEAPQRVLPGVDLEGMRQEILDAGATPVFLPVQGVFGVQAEQARRSAA